MANNKPTFDIVWCLSGDWEIDHRRQMITSFAKNMLPYGKILCINRPMCLFTSPFFKTRKFINWIRGRLGLKRITDNLYSYTPFVLIHDRIALKSKIFTYLNRKLLSFSLNKVINDICFSGRFRLSLVCVPTLIDYLGLVGDNGYIYDCYDNYVEFKFPTMNSQQVVYCDRLLTKNALVVFNTAQKLYEEKVKINPKSFFIPNAVNLELFDKVRKQNNGIPDDLKKIQHPIVGFIGDVHTNRIDFSLLQELVCGNPSVSFVFLGRMQKAKIVDEFLKIPNVHYLGFKKYEDLATYVLHFDIGIIPFKINELTKCLNPLKVYEYMAAGCPVVTTNIPEIQKFSNLVSIVKNNDEFDTILKKLLSSDLSELRERLLNEAQQHSWDKRTMEMITHIQECLSERYCAI